MAAYKPKLIEVALPLHAINRASAREKSIRHGHPSTLHLWWSRKPLAACRAVLWASLVDDPSAHPDRFPTEMAQAAERERLFRILERLVVWENSNNPDVLAEAQTEIARCFDGEPPAVLDPFAGGGSIPLEAQRLGLRALAGDLNPVAVLINKAMVEIPPRFAGCQPVHPDARNESTFAGGTQGLAKDSGALGGRALCGRAQNGEQGGAQGGEPGGERGGEQGGALGGERGGERGGEQGGALGGERGGERGGEQGGALGGEPGIAQGLAADVRAYGALMRDEAERRIGHLYPEAVGSNGEKLIPIAWIWARTVRSPDPAWSGHVPLVASWVLRNKTGKPRVWVEPIIERETRTISYRVREGGEPTFARTVNRGNGTCVATGAAIPVDYIRAEGRAGRMGEHLMAVVAEGSSGRQYCEPRAADIEACQQAVELAVAGWRPVGRLPPRGKGLGFSVQNYGYEEWWQLFTDRQLVALSTFSDLLSQIREQVLEDAKSAGLTGDETHLRDGGAGAVAYADAIVTYLALVADKCADYWSSICTWISSRETIRSTFIFPVMSMSWDIAEANPFSSSTGNWMTMVNWVGKAIEQFPAQGIASASQDDARTLARDAPGAVFFTDPPYYDNIGYADLADFFYVWLRRNLADVWPGEFAMILCPKEAEMIADPSRHQNKQQAKKHFELKMAEFMKLVAANQAADIPATFFYAYKATETTEDGRVRSTGWDTFLQAVVSAGLQVTATWPLRTERSARARSMGANAVASSLVLACRPRLKSAALATRSDFVAALNSEIPQAIKLLQSGNIAPVDLPQSTIGPGIKVYSRYAKVVEADGSSMPVSDALTIINEVLDDVLHGEDSELDAETRFALSWYAQHGFEPGPFGDADSIARAKNTTVDGVVRAGVGEASGGKFRLYRRCELDPGWDPADDPRLVAWESLQHLAARLDRSESMAARLLAHLGGAADSVRQLAYLLHKIASDKEWAEEALVYNGLISAWPILRSSAPGVDLPWLA